MVIWILCIAACALFTLLVVPSVIKNPLAWYHSYPNAVQQRIASLPQYEGRIPTQKRNLTKKAVALLAGCGVMTAVCLLAGAITFGAAFIHVFAVIVSVSLWDTLVLDIGWFCHSKRVRLPGTEDMVRAYHSVGKHLLGFALGTALAVGMGLMVGGIVWLVGGALR